MTCSVPRHTVKIVKETFFHYVTLTLTKSDVAGNLTRHRLKVHN
jgi:hypothetical protein